MNLRSQLFDVPPQKTLILRRIKHSKRCCAGLEIAYHTAPKSRLKAQFRVDHFMHCLQSLTLLAIAAQDDLSTVWNRPPCAHIKSQPTQQSPRQFGPTEDILRQSNRRQNVG